MKMMNCKIIGQEGLIIFYFSKSYLDELELELELEDDDEDEDEDDELQDNWQRSSQSHYLKSYLDELELELELEDDDEEEDDELYDNGLKNCL